MEEATAHCSIAKFLFFEDQVTIQPSAFQVRWIAFVSLPPAGLIPWIFNHFTGSSVVYIFFFLKPLRLPSCFSPGSLLYKKATWTCLTLVFLGSTESLQHGRNLFTCRAFYKRIVLCGRASTLGFRNCTKSMLCLHTDPGLNCITQTGCFLVWKGGGFQEQFFVAPKTVDIL